ncbi:RNA polymerase sigma factor [Corynebacterium bovis]|uniref:RNA polymerase sigma-70 factor (ECF subfamily) n=1 Tax=Corynebacterium bovis DSM 20582 = CIP 54.80 TaxID=927655 RepID=A0A8I0CPG6_9CORY|nr:sigma-70 family RNA polymerase sigma factor [Corynebacterium bovis]MBB3115951.1 RNA polymerase sigma-70 factor (ECF subfamily) [Corynebacterium bovis DSM 20582 = CIP 54.80]QQC46908.1 sigma-70 family RNA polymerase sigma factor [Corynebacterium bovis]RRO79503.1 RNA polymerase sigma factor SigM [Corynebacterium bovis]RRO87579.1 RNA polymerase sigma factor SigM [Corynebacterium bovis]RRO94375.1 RNA polymerase sigma factor SigM [Corynebacterium bovis]
MEGHARSSGHARTGPAGVLPGREGVGAGGVGRAQGESGAAGEDSHATGVDPTHGDPDTAAHDSDAAGDADLLRRYRAGDAEGYRELLRRHQVRLWWVVHRAGVPWDECGDVLQEAMFSIHRAAPAFRGGSSVATWMHAIVRNVALTYMRQRSRAPETTSLDTPRSLDALQAVADVGVPDPADNAVTQDQLRAVRGALAALDPRLRTVMELTEIEGLSVAGAAATLGIPPGTVKSRRARARRHLRRRLLEDGPFRCDA